MTSRVDGATGVGTGFGVLETSVPLMFSLGTTKFESSRLLIFESISSMLWVGADGAERGREAGAAVSSDMVTSRAALSFASVVVAGGDAGCAGGADKGIGAGAAVSSDMVTSVAALSTAVAFVAGGGGGVAGRADTDRGAGAAISSDIVTSRAALS